MVGEISLLGFLCEFAVSYTLSKGIDKTYQVAFPPGEIKELQKTYQSAYNIWSEGVDTYYARKFSGSFQDLLPYIESPTKIKDYKLAEFIQVWIKEIEKNVIASTFIFKNETRKNQKNLSVAVQELKENQDKSEIQTEERYNFLLEKINYLESNQYLTKGRGSGNLYLSIKSVENHYPRCLEIYSESNHNDFRFLSDFQKEKIGLYEQIVDGHLNYDSISFILYGEATIGKSTELLFAANRMINSEIFSPVFYSLKDYIGQDLEDQLRLEEHRQTNKRIVVFLDGLDENTVKNRELALSNINNLYHRFNNLIIVVSCRTNFKDENKLEDFTTLTILPFYKNDIIDYIQFKNFSGGERLIKEIIQKEYFDIIRTPFYLNAVIDYYKTNSFLPNTPSILYDYLIHESFTWDSDKKISKELSSEYINGKKLITEFAFILILSEKNELTVDEMNNVFTVNQISDINHYGIIKSIENYTFEHNAFKEYLIAREIAGLPYETISNFIFLPGINKLKSSWYNIVILLLGIMDKSSISFTNLKDWIIENEPELLLYLDPTFFDIDERNKIFYTLLEEYYNIKRIYIDDSTARRLVNFCNTSGVVDVLMAYVNTEIHIRTRNAFVLLRYASLLLYLDNSKLEIYIEKLLEVIQNTDVNNWSSQYVLNPLKNDYFKDKIDIIYPILRKYPEYYGFSTIISILEKDLEKSPYLNDLFDWCKEIEKKSNDKPINIFIYQYTEYIKDRKNITNFLTLVISERSFFDSDTHVLIKSLLDKAIEFCENDKEFIFSIVEILKEYFIDTELRGDSLYIRNFIVNSGYWEEIYEHTLTQYGNFKENNDEKFRQEARFASFCMTEKKFDNLISSYDASDPSNLNIIWGFIPYWDVALHEYCRKKAFSAFNQEDPQKHYIKQEIYSHELLFNYQKFEEELDRALLLVDGQVEYWKQREHIPSCIFSFIAEHKESNQKPDKVQIKNQFQDITNFELFRLEQIINIKNSERYLEYPFTEEQLVWIQNETTKNIIEVKYHLQSIEIAYLFNLKIEDKYIEQYFSLIASKRFFPLLYHPVMISKGKPFYSQNKLFIYFLSTYSSLLKSYIEKRLSSHDITYPPLYLTFLDYVFHEKEDNFLTYIYNDLKKAKRFGQNEQDIEEAIVIYFTKFLPSYHISLKEIITTLSTSSQLAFVGNLDETENKYKESFLSELYKNSKTIESKIGVLNLMFPLGSLFALQEINSLIKSHPEEINTLHIRLRNYNESAIDDLINLSTYIDINAFGRFEILKEELNENIEKIALQSQEALDKVIAYFISLTKMSTEYAFFNRKIELFKYQYYDKQAPKISIIQAKQAFKDHILKKDIG